MPKKLTAIGFQVRGIEEGNFIQKIKGVVKINTLTIYK
jgi:hypothetical protein